MPLLPEGVKQLISSENLCMSCMRNIGDEKKCPHCGYHRDTVQKVPLLPVRTCIGNRYLVGKVLDSDGEGNTYIGWDLQEKVPVNIREFLPDKFTARIEDNPGVRVMVGCEQVFIELKKSFEEMWARLSKLSGVSSLVTVTDIIHAFGTVYVVYEHVDGISLRDFLLRSKTGFVTWDKAKQLLMPVLSTLGVLHQNGIIHRGISPDTLIIGEDGKIKITGFAVSEMRTAGGRINHTLCDGYAAIEQYGYNAQMGPWTDIYSFGAVLYRALIGMDPMSATERMNQDRLMVPGKFAEVIPAGVINGLIDSLQILPQDRVRTADGLRQELMSAPAPQPPVITNQPVKPVEEEGPPKEEKKKKKQSSPASIVIKTVLIVIAVSLVLAVAGWAISKLAHSGSFHGETTSEADTSESFVVVPDFVRGGIRYDSTLAGRYPGLDIVKVPEETEDSEKIGYVIGQDIPAGKSVPRGTTVKVTVGVAPAEFEFPDITNVAEDDAVKTLEELGLVVKVEYNDDDSSFNAGEGNVQYSSVSPGATAHKGQKVTIVVYKPSEDTTVPNETETNLTRAESQTQPVTQETESETEAEIE